MSDKPNAIARWFSQTPDVILYGILVAATLWAIDTSRRVWAVESDVAAIKSFLMPEQRRASSPPDGTIASSGEP
jgi:hypothetical protein